MSRRVDGDRVRGRPKKPYVAPMPSGRYTKPADVAMGDASERLGPPPPYTKNTVHSGVHYSKMHTKGRYDLNQVIMHPKTNQKYFMTELLGKGGFAKVYLAQRITHKEGYIIDTKEKLAGKIVLKETIKKDHQRQKMALEIRIHSKLDHPNIVQLYTHFDDDKKVIVILEFCQNRSLMEVSKRRGVVTQPELRYYMKNLLNALIYIHDKGILHRDLKLSNILLGRNMMVKLADFGLAVQISPNQAKRTTLCGTPNYIAPEILMKVGHGKPADVWSAGVAMYALLVGTPPFETQSLKTTYQKIKTNKWTLPAEYIHQAAGAMITNMLSAKPERRHNVHQLNTHRFMTHGFLPEAIPDSAMTTEPNFNNEQSFLVMAENAPQRDQKAQYDRDVRSRQPARLPAGVGPEPRQTRNMRKSSDIGANGGRRAEGGEVRRPLQEVNEGAGVRDERQSATERHDQVERPRAYKNLTRYTNQILMQTQPFVEIKKKIQTGLYHEPTPVEMEVPVDPSIRPVYWISKWVDYSDKYGLGYTLIDESVGVLFNDSYRLLLHRNGIHIQVVTPPPDLREEMLLVNEINESNNRDLHKMYKLLKHFRGYMTEHLVNAGEDYAPTMTDAMRRLPYLVKWFRTSKAILMMLSNGAVQINFFSCHSKLLFDPLVEAVTCIDSDKVMTTYNIRLLHTKGVNKVLLKLILYARNLIENLHANLHPYSGITGKMMDSNGKFRDLNK